MLPHPFRLLKAGGQLAALAALVVAMTAPQTRAAPPDDHVVVVAFNPAALHARDLDILEGRVRAALPPSTVQLSEGRTTIVARVSDPQDQESVRFLEAVRKRLAGDPAFVLKDQPMTIYRLAPGPEAGAQRGRDGPKLVKALELLRPPLPGVTVEDGIDSAIVHVDDVRIAPAVAAALSHVRLWNLAVTPLSPTSWRVAYDAQMEKMLRHGSTESSGILKMFDLHMAPGQALLSRLMIGEMLRGELRDPLDFEAEQTADGAEAWVADPHGRYGERLKQALAGDSSLTLSSAPGEVLIIALSAPPPPASAESLLRERHPEIDKLNAQLHGLGQLFGALQTLADRTPTLTQSGGGVDVLTDDATVRKRTLAALAEAGLRAEAQPGRSLRVVASERHDAPPNSAMLVATVEARARALGLSAVTVTPNGAGRAEAHFHSQAAADAFRKAILANSTGFAIRVVDDDGRGDEPTPPFPGDDRLRQRDGGRLWLKPGTPVTGAMITRAAVVDDPVTHSPAVRFKLSREGRSIFAGLTSANVGARLAIVLDGVIITAPTIVTPITGDKGEITCNCSADEAQKLASAMVAHSADLPLKLVEP